MLFVCKRFTCNIFIFSQRCYVIIYDTIKKKNNNIPTQLIPMHT